MSLILRGDASDITVYMNHSLLPCPWSGLCVCFAAELCHLAWEGSLAVGSVQCFTGRCDDVLIHIMELGARQDAKLSCANILSLCKSVMLNVNVEY